MIKFKNKSEQQRYLRVANCIMALNDPQNTSQQTKNDTQHIYMKVFRFLADILTRDEFEAINYYHVSRFIGNILHLSCSADENDMKDALPQMSLR